MLFVIGNKAKEILRIILSNIPLIVFIRTFLFGFGGFAVSILALWSYQLTNLPNDAIVSLLTIPICTLGAGVWYVMQAKKLYGKNWSIGVSGILGITVTLTMLYFLIGALTIK